MPCALYGALDSNLTASIFGLNEKQKIMMSYYITFNVNHFKSVGKYTKQCLDTGYSTFNASIIPGCQKCSI